MLRFARRTELVSAEQYEGTREAKRLKEINIVDPRTWKGDFGVKIGVKGLGWRVRMNAPQEKRCSAGMPHNLRNCIPRSRPHGA
jgi:hypothetical protein